MRKYRSSDHYYPQGTTALIQDGVDIHKQVLLTIFLIIGVGIFSVFSFPYVAPFLFSRSKARRAAAAAQSRQSWKSLWTQGSDVATAPPTSKPTLSRNQRRRQNCAKTRKSGHKHAAPPPELKMPEFRDVMASASQDMASLGWALLDHGRIRINQAITFLRSFLEDLIGSATIIKEVPTAMPDSASVNYMLQNDLVDNDGILGQTEGLTEASEEAENVEDSHDSHLDTSSDCWGSAIACPSSTKEEMVPVVEVKSQLRTPEHLPISTLNEDFAKLDNTASSTISDMSEDLLEIRPPKAITFASGSPLPPIHTALPPCEDTESLTASYSNSDSPFTANVEGSQIGFDTELESHDLPPEQHVNCLTSPSNSTSTVVALPPSMNEFHGLERKVKALGTALSEACAREAQAIDKLDQLKQDCKMLEESNRTLAEYASRAAEQIEDSRRELESAQKLKDRYCCEAEEASMKRKEIENDLRIALESITKSLENLAESKAETEAARAEVKALKADLETERRRNAELEDEVATLRRQLENFSKQSEGVEVNGDKRKEVTTEFKSQAEIRRKHDKIEVKEENEQSQAELLHLKDFMDSEMNRMNELLTLERDRAEAAISAWKDAESKVENLSKTAESHLEQISSLFMTNIAQMDQISKLSKLVNSNAEDDSVPTSSPVSATQPLTIDLPLSQQDAYDLENLFPNLPTEVAELTNDTRSPKLNHQVRSESELGALRLSKELDDARYIRRQELYIELQTRELRKYRSRCEQKAKENVDLRMALKQSMREREELRRALETESDLHPSAAPSPLQDISRAQKERLAKKLHKSIDADKRRRPSATSSVSSVETPPFAASAEGVADVHVPNLQNETRERRGRRLSS
ncbi:hypothetical protein HDU96_008654 [Phlyctochytrium bullatum]|nr:hypothetical protein HDU96_008654 [Phlyctochytrium bullatum]